MAEPPVINAAIPDPGWGRLAALVAVQCDHADDAAVEALVERVRRDSGRLDILVNNAAAVDIRALPAPGGFWEKPSTLPT